MSIILMSKIKEINGRFQEILTEKDVLNLNASSAGGSKKARQRRETTTLVEEAKVYGRETEKKEIVEFLLKDDSRNDGGFSVIPIVGMGGLGKTTLAQLVYNDKRVQDHFDLKAWTCVSEDFDVKGLTKKILRSNTEQTIDDSDLNLLQEELKEKLSQKKFLLILDNVWNENYNDWFRLSRPFEAGAKGSKIIVTTRNQEVADIMGTASPYQLKKLSIDDCLAVFAQHSLGSDELLEEIGKKIVAKCDGLPLAAQTLGGLLRGKDRGVWEDVLSSNIWELPEDRCPIIPALATQECVDDIGSTVEASVIQQFVGSTIKGQHVYKLLSKCKKRIIAVLPLVRKVFTYLVLEATSFVGYLLGYLVSEVISSLRDIFSCLLLRSTSFVRHKLKYYVFESISSLWELFGNLALDAISAVEDLVKKSKWSFLPSFGIAVCACILARATPATREEFQRQLTGAVGIVFSVTQWIITSVYFTLADLGVKSNYSASVLLLLFSIATLFLFKKDEDATDSSHGAYSISSRNLRISRVPAFDYVPSTANRFLLLIIRNLINQFNLVNDLHSISSAVSLIAPAAHQVNQQYQGQNIKKVCQLLGKHKKPSLAVFYLVLEAASFLLDLYGKSKRGFLLVAFLLSAFGFGICMYTCIMGRSRTSVQSQKQLVRTVEFAFSVVQLIVTLVYLILAEMHVKNNFSASVFPLVFAIINAVFTFKNDGVASDSSSHTDDDLHEDLPVTSIPLIPAIPSTSNERFLIGMMVESWNPERVLNMICNLASIMAPAADHGHNLQYQLLNIQVHLPNNIAARGAIDSTMFIQDEDAETNPSLSLLTILISND